MAKSKAERKKHKRKAKQKQIKAARFHQTIRGKALFFIEEAHYSYNTGDISRAVKSIKKAARMLPTEEEVFTVMGYIASNTEDPALELDALAGLERIGKLTDEMKVNRVFILVHLEKYKECSKELDDVFENFTRLKIKGKRKIKKKLEDVKEYCQMMMLMEEKKKTQNTVFSRSGLSKKNRSRKHIKMIKTGKKNLKPNLHHHKTLKSPMFP